MPRSRLVSLAVLLAVAGGFVAGCGGGGNEAKTQTAGRSAESIVLLGSGENEGPWSRSLSLKLGNIVHVSMFYVCAVWKQQPPTQACDAKAGNKLPAGAMMRLEQNPVGPAVAIEGSPGWGTVATSDGPALNAVLSNNVAGNHVGRVTYRARLLNAAGGVIGTSNEFTVDWHK